MKTIPIGLLIAASMTAACTAPPAHETATEAPAVSVVVDRAIVADLRSQVEAGGVVRARTTALIASRVMAPITQIKVRAGDRVRRGDTLVTLDAREIKANKDSAVAAARAASEAGRAAEAEVRAAESALGLARADHDRTAQLYAKRSATSQELDRVVASLAAAEAQHTSAQARLAAANAARDAAHSSAEAATVGTTYAVLSAPFNGIVTERRADPGSMALPGAPLLMLEDPATYRLEVQVDEARASLVRTRQTVAVRIDNAQVAGDGWSEGQVDEMARLESASHTFVIKITLPQSEMLRSGLFGRARFDGPVRQALTVPRASLIRRGQLTFVYFVDAESRARLRMISPGVSDGDRVEVLAGLREHDRVVIDPPASLTDGSRVTGGQR